jgi:hypothetical protein
MLASLAREHGIENEHLNPDAHLLVIPLSSFLLPEIAPFAPVF